MPTRVILRGEFSDVAAPRAAALGEPVTMPSSTEASPIPDHRLSIEKRGDGAIIVRVRSEGPDESRLPDAVFAFRNGDPQYAYWQGRLAALRSAKP